MKTTKTTATFPGPTVRMAEALENEGLRIDWPVKYPDPEDLAIEATFYTGEGWEKLVLIDLRNQQLRTKKAVDAAVAAQLEDAFNEFDVDEETRLYMEGDVPCRPDAARLVEDMKEQEARLQRFVDVASAVVDGREIPPAEKPAGNGEVTLDRKTAESVVRLLSGIRNSAAARCAIDEITRQLALI